MSFFWKLCLGFLIILPFSRAWAEIKIGQTVGMTGLVSGTVKEAVAGAKLYIDSVNAKGGVLGERIDLITLDDQFDVKQAADIDATLAGLHRELFREANPIPVKWALQRMGRIGEGIRLPLTPLSVPLQPALEAALRQAGVL